MYIVISTQYLENYAMHCPPHDGTVAHRWKAKGGDTILASGDYRHAYEIAARVTESNDYTCTFPAHISVHEDVRDVIDAIVVDWIGGARCWIGDADLSNGNPLSERLPLIVGGKDDCAGNGDWMDEFNRMEDDERSAAVVKFLFIHLGWDSDRVWW